MGFNYGLEKRKFTEEWKKLYSESEKIIVLLLFCEIKKSQPFLCKTIGSEGNKNRQIVLVTICRPCSVFRCYLGSYLSSMGKRRFSSTILKLRKTAYG